MKAQLLTSIIINNYNYDRFIKQAIESALNQTYPHAEVIVVDDGSSDTSRDLIQSYGNRVTSIFKENGGQASALNAGFAASRGDVIFFLDADDIFQENKIEQIVSLYNQILLDHPESSISDQFSYIDEHSLPLDIDLFSGLCPLEDQLEITGHKDLQAQVLTQLSSPAQSYKFAAKYRYLPYLGSPTSGFSLSRALAEKIFPIPTENVKTSADDFVAKSALILGNVYTTHLKLSQYRVHGNNNWQGRKKPHQESFFHTLDDFLNSKLISVNKKPVIFYLNSTHAKSYYRRYYGYNCSKQLFELALKVITWHINLRTIGFSLRTLLLAAYCELRR